MSKSKDNVLNGKGGSQNISERVKKENNGSQELPQGDVIGKTPELALVKQNSNKEPKNATNTGKEAGVKTKVVERRRGIC